jgi:UDP-N-acetylmuramyl pentapeptide phosphotransferase/UDP-N-acetylglucosamine-1-phosphate transferase
VRELGLDGQKQKQGTPTMGGILIIMAILIPCLLFAKLNNVYIILMIVSTIWMGVIGFVDDYIKVFKKDKRGITWTLQNNRTSGARTDCRNNFIFLTRT